ncbi:hypothetical protein GEV33_011584 [Tenebrio molitor]|uniref:Uncharacterized protein n=1 Tax=Tenebrio molitor TaxID=7067 RepID=A0A8J6L4U2_TENMO|nr:hypothetical protein GEV33_011584 [Tenebrio molitor]
MDRDSFSSRCLVSIVMLLQTVPGDSGAKPSDESKTLHPESDGTATHILDYAPAPGWTVHVTKEGRLYYCNNVGGDTICIKALLSSDRNCIVVFAHPQRDRQGPTPRKRTKMRKRPHLFLGSGPGNWEGLRNLEINLTDVQCGCEIVYNEGDIGKYDAGDFATSLLKLMLITCLDLSFSKELRNSLADLRRLSADRPRPLYAPNAITTDKSAIDSRILIALSRRTARDFNGGGGGAQTPVTRIN